MNIPRITSFVLPLLMGTILFSCDSPSNVGPGVSRDLATQRKALLSSIVYDLKVTVPESRADSVVIGTTITFKLKKADQDLPLDFKGQAIHSLSVNGADQKINLINEHLILDQSSLKTGQNKVEITVIASDVALNRNDDYMFSLFVPDRASSAFPCFDQPDLKAVYSLTMDIPMAWQAIGNAPKEDSQLSRQRKIVSFSPTERISTYQFAFVAGDFQVEQRQVGGREMTLYHREDDKGLYDQSVDEIFNLHAAGLDWMEAYTGVKYPFSKIEFVALPGFPFAGMEHVGAIQYRSELLFLDGSATVNQKLRRASLIAHETAHMWFGNYVTMEWFEDVWMKEVFANFMADKIVAEAFPEVNHDLNFLFAHYPAAYKVDRTEGTHPIRQPLDNLKDAGNMYGSIIYHKAPIAMKQLELLVGENRLRLALSQYLENNAYDNADWDDLMNVLARISGKDMAAWSDVWIKEAGMPRMDIVSIETPDRSELIINQTDPLDKGRVWPQSWSLSMDFEGGPVDYAVQLDAPEFLIKRSNKNELASFIQLNANGAGYGVFQHGLDYVKGEFLFNKGKVDVSAIEDDLQRGAGFVNLHEFLLHERFHPQLYYNFLEVYIDAEANDQILAYLLDITQEVFYCYFDESLRKQHAGNLETTLWNKLLNVSSPESKSLLLNAYIDVASTDKGLTRLKSLWKGENVPEGLVLSKKQKESLALNIALIDSKEGLSYLQMQIDSTANEEKKERLEFVKPVFSLNEEERKQFVESLLDPVNRDKETWVLLALQYLHHPNRNEQSISLLMPTLDLLEPMAESGSIFFVKRVMDRTLAGYQSAEAASLVNEFLEQNPELDVHLKRKLLQSADPLFRARKNMEFYQSL